MEFLWVWLYGFKFPLSIICGAAIAGCFINFLSVKSSGRGDSSLWGTLHIAIGIAVIWAGVYALPAPDYNVKTITVYKDRIVEKPVVKKVVTMTKTITNMVRYTQDSRFNYCMNRVQGTVDDMYTCMKFSKEYMEPRVVVKEVPVKVYSGERVVMYTRDARMRWCYAQSGTTLDQCLNFAFKMEAGPQVQVRYVHDSYQTIFDKCNAMGSISSNDPNPVALRNERIKTCGELALRASSNH